MRKGLWSATGLLVIMALIVGGCGGRPEGIGPLTDNEKARLIEIALNTPEVSAQLKIESVYKADVRWIAIVWQNSKAVEWWVLDYEEVADGYPQYVSESAVIYPRVLIRFGEPERVHVQVVVDRETEKVILTQRLPVKGGPVLPKKTPPPEGD